MKCIICKENMQSYFEKDFHGFHGLGRVQYERCPSCGFVFSKTHAEMSQHEWEQLNLSYHDYYETHECAEDPNWLDRLHNQAEIISALAEAGALPRKLKWVDYGCGNGTLADSLSEKGLVTHKYEVYRNRPGYLTRDSLHKSRYDLVLNTSVFEHVRNRASLDEIAGLVDERGVLGIHTLVSREIPGADWFYLLPVHCAFFTNRSMQILFDAWNFHASFYHVGADMWFWFKRDTVNLNRFIEEADRTERDEIYYKIGFMDYSK